jgi:hypothetical protein
MKELFFIDLVILLFITLLINFNHNNNNINLIFFITFIELFNFLKHKLKIQHK